MADMVDEAWLDGIDFNQESDLIDWTALASQTDYNTWDNSEASDAWIFQSTALDNGAWGGFGEQGPQRQEIPVARAEPVLPDDHLPLSDRLRAAIKEPLDGSRKGFIPLSKLKDIVDQPSITQALRDALPTLSFDVAKDKAFWISLSNPRVFAILALLNRIQDIQLFIDDNVCDTALPLVKICEVGGKPELRPKLSQTTTLRCFQGWSPSLLDMFEDVQWTVLAPSFLGPELRFYSFDDKAVLPWIENDQLKSTTEGGFGSVYRVKIDPSHHNFNHPLSSNESFAVKQVSDLQFTDCEGFTSSVIDRIDHEHLLAPNAVAKHGDKCLFVMPWADGGNLRDLWQSNPEPSCEPNTVNWMLTQAEGIASGLHALHNVQTDSITRRLPQSPSRTSRSDKRSKTRWYGRHGDIKPENALCFRKRDRPFNEGRIVLADFGLTAFHTSATAGWARVGGYTKRYCAPEVYHAPLLGWDFEETPAYDVWSLGCVFLEFLTWLVCGWPELESFEARRCAEREGGQTVIRGFEGAFFDLTLNAATGTVEGNVHPVVSELFERLRRNPKTSQACQELLFLVRHSMLEVRPCNRLPIKDILGSLTEIRKKCAENTEFAAGTRAPMPYMTSGCSTFDSSQSVGDRSVEIHQVAGRETNPSAAGALSNNIPSNLRSATAPMPSISEPIRPLTRSLRGSKRTRSPQYNTEPRNKHQKTKLSPKPPTLEAKPRRFACPFYKNDPVRYRQHQTCCGPGWPQFHRVKEHIYRRHCSKFRCQRCHDGFRDVEELLAHQAAKRCEEKADIECLHGADLSDAQVSEIRKRACKSKTEEEKWRDLYRLLFPNDAAVPSPYYDEVEISQPCQCQTGSSTGLTEVDGFENYLKQGLSPGKRRELAATVHRYVSHDPDEDLDQRVTDALLDIHRQLVSYYSQSLSLSMTSHSTVPSLIGQELRTKETVQEPCTNISATDATHSMLMLASHEIPTDGIRLSSCWKGHGKEADLLRDLDQRLVED